MALFFPCGILTLSVEKTQSQKRGCWSVKQGGGQCYKLPGIFTSCDRTVGYMLPTTPKSSASTALVVTLEARIQGGVEWCHQDDYDLATFPDGKTRAKLAFDQSLRLPSLEPPFRFTLYLNFGRGLCKSVTFVLPQPSRASQGSALKHQAPCWLCGNHKQGCIIDSCEVRQWVSIMLHSYTYSAHSSYIFWCSALTLGGLGELLGNKLVASHAPSIRDISFTLSECTTKKAKVWTSCCGQENLHPNEIYKCFYQEGQSKFEPAGTDRPCTPSISSSQGIYTKQKVVSFGLNGFGVGGPTSWARHGCRCKSLLTGLSHKESCAWVCGSECYETCPTR